MTAIVPHFRQCLLGLLCNVVSAVGVLSLMAQGRTAWSSNTT